MRNATRLAIVLLVAGALPLGAQSRTGVAVTPFIGLTIPGRDLLLRPGLTAGRDQEKQATFAVVGARVAVGLGPKFELEGDLGVGKSGLNTSSINAPSGTDARVVTGSGRLAVRLEEPLAPLSATISGGVAAVARSFSSRTPGQPVAVSDKTHVGGVIGALLSFRMADRAALALGADVFIYNASFDVAATGSQAAGTTQSLTQRDIRFTLGVRVPLAGF